MSGIDFVSPSMRASSSDLSIAIAPIGLVELADEEFEVNGPRLSRYSNHWSWYLGFHHATRREMGEAQLTFNYVKALSDFLTAFSFGRGVYFRTPLQTSAIVPSLLSKVWEVDNNKESVLWEMGTFGGVNGDVFVKIAYEDEYPDPAGNIHPGRVRILPINPGQCFPEFHPHDRERLIRFKMKYRFWGRAEDGTKQVFTYTEILTNEVIEEFINDECIDSRPNPMGVIPVVHIPNIRVPGSPWGLSDIGDVISLNRQYNEVATQIADIVAYHSAPVTVITGAKASNLEKGPKKVWGGLPKDAQVFNLELGDNLSGPMDFLAMLKKSMHEMTGVPEGALGDVQPISNTSGVALAIQYQPTMFRDKLKKVNYSFGLQKINELILRQLAIKEPQSFVWDPGVNDELKEGQAVELDPLDPLTYQTECHWPPPLPTDRLAALAEVQQMMSLGLESKRGALRELGEEFPDNKSREIFKEQVDDAYDQGALDVIRSTINAAILAETGLLPGPDGPQQDAGAGVTGTNADGSSTPPLAPPSVEQVPQVVAAMQKLNTIAYGTTLAVRRNPDNDD